MDDSEGRKAANQRQTGSQRRVVGEDDKQEENRAAYMHENAVVEPKECHANSIPLESAAFQTLKSHMWLAALMAYGRSKIYLKY